MSILNFRKKSLESLKLFLYRSYCVIGIVFIPLFSAQLLVNDGTIYYNALVYIFPAIYICILALSYMVKGVRTYLDLITFIFHTVLTLFVIGVLMHYGIDPYLIIGFLVLVAGVLFTLQHPVHVVLYSGLSLLELCIALLISDVSHLELVVMSSIVMLFGITAYIVTRYKTLLILRLVNNEKITKENEQKYKMLLETMNEGVIQVDNADSILYVNEKFSLISGYTESELLGKNAGLLLLQDPSHQAIIDDVISNKKAGKPGEFEIKMRHRNGHDIWVHNNGTPIYNDNNEIVGSLGILRDISNEVKQRKDLKASEERFRKLFENNLAGVFRVTLGGKILECNNSFARILGYENREEMLEMQVSDLYRKLGERDKFIADLQKSGALVNYELEHKKKDGSPVHVLVNVTLVKNRAGEPSYLEGTSIDISMLKQTTRDLKASEDRFKLLSQAAIEGILISENMVVIDCNDQFAEMHKYGKREDVIGMKFTDFIAPGYHEIVSNHLLSAQTRTYEMQSICKDGTLLTLEARGKNIPLGGREVRISVLYDITARKRIEEELQRKWERDEQLIESSPYGISIVVDGKLAFVNTVACQLLGYENAAEIIGSKRVSDFLFEEYMDAAKIRKTRLLAGEDLPAVEVKVRTKNMDVVDLETKSILLDYEGKQAVYTVFQDISARKMLQKEKVRAEIAEATNQKLEAEIRERMQAQSELRSVQEFTQSIIDSSLDMIIATDQERRVTLFNKAAQRFFGYEPEAVLGKSTVMLYENEAVVDMVWQQLAKVGFYRGEIKNVAKDGRIFDTYITAAQLLDEHGVVSGVMGVSRDITEIKAATEQLRRSEERYRDLFENATDLIQGVDLDGNFLYVNKAWRKTLGYSQRELKKVMFQDVVHAKEWAQIKKIFNAAAKGNSSENIEMTFVSKSKQEFVVEGNVNPRYKDGIVHSVRSIFRNVTATRHAELLAQEQAARIRSIFESSTHLIWSVDKDLHLTSFNKNFSDNVLKIHGFRPVLAERIVPITTTNKLHEKNWIHKYSEAFAGTAQQFEANFHDREGNAQWEEIFLHPIYDAAHNVIGVSGIGHPITDKKKAEQKIRSQGAKINSIFESTSHMMIWTLDRNFQITSFNKNLYNTLLDGIGEKIETGSNFLDVMFPHMDVNLQQGLKEAYANTLAGTPGTIEGPVILKNGSRAWFETFLNPIRTGSEPGGVEEISCLAHEITEKKTTEWQIKQSLKEKEVLLKEVHHRVKNNLQVISSILNLQSSYVKDQKVVDILHESQNRIKSMSFIHESLYQTENLSSINFSEYISNLSKSLVHSYQLFEGLVDLDLEVNPVELNLDQAIPCGLIVNELVSNSLKYAFPGKVKGAIFIKIKQKGKKVMMNIGDTGIGLPKGFDYKNTDTLGLQLVITLVEQIDGKLELKKSKGTNYLITFEHN